MGRRHRANPGTHAHRRAYSDGHGNTYGRAYSDGNGNAYGRAYSDGNGNAYGRAYSDGNAHAGAGADRHIGAVDGRNDLRSADSDIQQQAVVCAEHFG